MGNCQDIPFQKVWHSALADKIRNAPYPACYKIKAPNGDKLADQLKQEFKTAAVL